MPLFLFLCLIVRLGLLVLYWIEWWRGHCLVPDFKGKAFSLLSLSMMLAVSFSCVYTAAFKCLNFPKGLASASSQGLRCSVASLCLSSLATKHTWVCSSSVVFRCHGTWPCSQQPPNYFTTLVWIDETEISPLSSPWSCLHIANKFHSFPEEEPKNWVTSP